MLTLFNDTNVRLSILLYILACLSFSFNNTKQTLYHENMKIINHSYSNYEQIAITHLDLDLKISFDNKKITGKAGVQIKRLNKEANQIILDTKFIDILSVSDNKGDNLVYKLGKFDSILGSALIIELPKTSDYFWVEYKTTDESEALQWQSPEQTYGKKHPFLFTQSQAILARTWIPLQDCPAVRFTYNATVTIDKDLLPLMSASNPREKNAKHTYSYTMPQPIPSYLMALCAGDLAYQSLGDSCGVYAEPGQLAECAKEFEDLQSMIDQASELYGAYRWGVYDVVVLPPSFPFGGMENPRLTFATPTIIAGDKSLVALIAHELAHSWSGNLVTNETWADFWLNEGFTVYFENRIMEKIYGKQYADMLTVLGMGDLQTTLKELKQTNPGDTRLYLDLEGRSPDDGVTDIAYEKGRFFLLMVENVVGRENFDVFLNNYFKKKAFKTITTKEFIAILDEDLLSKNPEWKAKVNIDEWVYQEGLPANCPNPTSIEFEKVTADVKGFQANGKLPNTVNYTTHHWLQFLRELPEGMSLTQMESLDKAFNLTKTGNSEIACDWFKHAIMSKYEAAYLAMESFLVRVGRRKFLTPLYSRMVESDQIELAKKIFGKAKPGYHAVSNNTISALLYDK
jgi:leukotriene-A4 hydrolase